MSVEPGGYRCLETTHQNGMDDRLHLKLEEVFFEPVSIRTLAERFAGGVFALLEQHVLI
jgi:hypothetical protein